MSYLKSTVILYLVINYSFITVDSKTQCLIESDDKKNRITARQLSSHKKLNWQS